MSELTYVSITAYNKRRNEILVAGDIDAMIELMAANNNGLRPSSRHIAEITFHKARTGVRTLPMVLRIVSKKWLIERGYMSEDDGDVPLAENVQ